MPYFKATEIGDDNYISIDGEGNFVHNGEPIRFFGTNLVADGAFPVKEKAWFIAGRLRKMGFNLIRFHHMDNPSFPGVPWSPTDWTINITPMVRDEDGGTIANLMAGVGSAGKPYTISEYNHAFPNRYQSEGMLFLTAYSSFHDIDGIMFFDYGGSVTDWETDHINSYFGIHRLLDGSDFATFSWVSLDKNSLTSAQYSLLTLSSRAGNMGMIWDGTAEP